MDKNKANVPKIRFPGFTAPWEQHKLGDESMEIVAGGDIDKNKIVDSGKYPVLANALTNDGIVGYYKNDFRIKAPAVTVTGRGDVGHAKARKVDFTPVVRLLAVKTKHDVDFLENAINKHEVLVESTGVPQLTVPQLSKYKIYFPKTDDEEKVMGVFFKDLDNLITIHQRKLNHLQDKKKSLLQKMFPKNGEDFPELRFPGFTHPWEQRELGDVLENMKSGLSRMLSNNDIGLPVVRANNINDGILEMVNDVKYWYRNDPQGAKTDNYFIHKDNILVNFINSEAKMGTATIVDIEPVRATIYTTNILNLRTNDLVNPYFLYTLTQTWRYKTYIKLITKPAVNQASFTTVDFKKFRFSCPMIKEQQKIGELFKKFNNLIALHQRKLNHLQKQKKALLQQMFV